MKNIQAIKIGNTVNFSIDGKLQKKSCSSPEDANELFRALIKAKNDPSPENIKTVRILTNEKIRIAVLAGIEADPDAGEAYLAGFNTPIPETLLEVIKEYHENSYPLDAIVNFWKLLMINPDKRVRTSLFDFIKTHDFVLTDKGYMVVYKAVYRKDADKAQPQPNHQFEEFVSNQYLHVKKTWKCSANKYVVYKNIDGEYNITKFETAEKWDSNVANEVLGKLGDLYSALVIAENKEAETVVEDKVTYTDMHTRSMTIRLGLPVKMDRKDCNSDPQIDCSYGLHVGATKYVEKFANADKSIILACLVNPANVVAVPDYDHSKMRVTEYFPFAVATFENKKIDIVDQKYFEEDYINYEVEELEAQIAKIQAGELPIEPAQKAEKETRPMSELLKMLENRLFDVE